MAGPEQTRGVSAKNMQLSCDTAAVRYCRWKSLYGCRWIHDRKICLGQLNADTISAVQELPESQMAGKYSADYPSI